MTSAIVARLRGAPLVWSVAAALALLASGSWLGAPGVGYLAVAAGATAVSIAALVRWRGGARRWAIVVSALLVGLLAIAFPAQLELRSIATNWPGWQRMAAQQGLVTMSAELDEAIAMARANVDRALEAPRDRAEARRWLDRLPTRASETAVALVEEGRLVAWSGQSRVPVTDAPDGLDVVGNAFYLAVRVARSEGTRRAVAVVLVDAMAPGDRMTTALADRVARTEALSGFTFARPTAAAPGGDQLRYAVDGVPLFDLQPEATSQAEVAFRIGERGRLRVAGLLAIALLAFLIATWRLTPEPSLRLASLAIVLGATAIVPLNELSNLSRLFNSAVYSAEIGQQFSGNAGALAITSAILLLGVIVTMRRRRRVASRAWAGVVVAVVVLLGPFLLRELSRGIVIPPQGVDAPLWLIWEIPLFLAASVVLLAGAAAGGIVLGARRGLPPWVAPAIAGVAAILGPAVWDAPARWPWWYTIVWIAAIAALALSRQSRLVFATVATVAALGATTLVWQRTARGRVELAERDLASLAAADAFRTDLLGRFGNILAESRAPTTPQELLQQYVRSNLASAGYPAVLQAWPTDSAPSVELRTVDFGVRQARIAELVAQARRSRVSVIADIPEFPGLQSVLAAPGADSGVTVVVVGPSSRLYPPGAATRLLGIDAESASEPPYTVQLRERVRDTTGAGQTRWRREGSELHGDWVVATGDGAYTAHVEVDLRPLPVLVQRGALIVLLDLCLVGVLWLVAAVADGGAGRWLRARRRSWGRSYRARLSLTLFGFFIVPAAVFAIWSYQQLAVGARQARELLVRETLRAVVPRTADDRWIVTESRRLDSPLFHYRGAELVAASDPVFETLAPLGRLLDREVAVELAELDERTASQMEEVAGAPVLVGYRTQPSVIPGTVIAAPARTSDVPLELERRRRDLAVLVLFATAIAGLATFWLSGLVAGQLARPIGSLRSAALAIAAGERSPEIPTEPTTEFRPVFAAFRRMAADLNASRTALEEAERRTAAVLRNVASGVVAVDGEGRVLLANPRAEALLDAPLDTGAPLERLAPPSLAAIVSRFLRAGAGDEAFELEVGARQFRGQLTRLARGGAVVTVDDVTELARAQRVLAWGEMARQVAHEIKNPLTPIRLGVQHLKRARADHRVDFDRVLDQNVSRILGEIDRLDEIARAFSRYGSAPEERLPPESIDVAAVLHDVIALEQMGGDERVRWELVGADAPVHAMARRDELKEVLLNVLENARLADATRVVVALHQEAAATGAGVAIRVTDDGRGIAAEDRPRIFEPHFSTRTSGSGLGLAISRQLIDGWGGEIDVEPRGGGGGTTVVIVLRGKREAGSGTGE